MMQALMQLIKMGILTTARGEHSSNLQHSSAAAFVPLVLAIDMKESNDLLTKAISKALNKCQCEKALKTWNNS